MTAPIDHDAIVVGAGPVGRLLAAELQRRGIDVLLLEQRDDADETRTAPGRVESGRAIGLHPPVLAALEASGATERILGSAARITRGAAYDGTRRLATLEFDRLRVRFPFAASLPQRATERAVSAGGPSPRHRARVTEVVPLGDRVAVRMIQDEQQEERSARVVVLASGSADRGLARPFARLSLHEYPDAYLMADAVTAIDPREDARTAIISLDRRGVLESFPLAGGGRRLVARIEAGTAHRGDDAAIAALRLAVEQRTGSAALAAAIESVSAFRIRRAALLRMRLDAGSLLFAIGDAAHEVSPIGGQGMNLGLLDAATLAPILAACVRGEGEQEGALRAWERDRLASARISARLGGLNTALGRTRSAGAHRILTAGVRAGMRTPIRRTLARAYTMGYDRAA